MNHIRSKINQLVSKKITTEGFVLRRNNETIMLIRNFLMSAVASGPADPVLAGPLFIRRIPCLVMVANKPGNGRRRFVHVYNRDR